MKHETKKWSTEGIWTKKKELTSRWMQEPADSHRPGGTAGPPKSRRLRTALTRRSKTHESEMKKEEIKPLKERRPQRSVFWWRWVLVEMASVSSCGNKSQSWNTPCSECHRQQGSNWWSEKIECHLQVLAESEGLGVRNKFWRLHGLDPKQLWARHVWTEPSKFINDQLKVWKWKENGKSPASWLGQAERITAARRSCWLLLEGSRHWTGCSETLAVRVDLWRMLLELTTLPTAQWKKHSIQ